jgi:hypothetical protein
LEASINLRECMNLLSHLLRLSNNRTPHHQWRGFFLGARSTVLGAQFMGKEPAASIPPLRRISRHISYLAAYRSDLEYSWQVAPPLFLDVRTLVLIDETLLCPNSLGGQHRLRPFFPTTKAAICGQSHLYQQTPAQFERKVHDNRVPAYA